MPAFIRTPKDEARWSKAKKAASKSKGKSEEGFTDQDWALTNYIYHKMHKAEIAQTIMDKLSKGPGDEDEDDIQDHGQLDEEDLKGMSTFDPYEEENSEGEDWLAEHDPEKKKEEPEEAQPEEKKRGGYSEWAARNDYNDQEKAKIKSLVDEGYSPREAERMAGAHKGAPTNFQDALTHPLKPSQPSEKMLARLKDLAKPWLENAERHGKINADPEKNPQKHAAGQMLQAHESATKDYNKAYNDFLNSDATKNLKGLDRHKAVQAWKQQWKQQNPEYSEGTGKMSEAQQHYKTAAETQQRNLDERMKHIATGALGEGGMSMQEAAQHVGGTKGGEDEGYTAGTVQDPSAIFARQNPQLVNMLNAEQHDRLKRVMSARASQGLTGNKPAAAPKVIRRPAKPEGGGLT